MAGLKIDPAKCTRCLLCVQQCPFQALDLLEDQIVVNANCKMCQICMRNCPVQAISLETLQRKEIDKSQYQGVLVYIEHDGEKIHPVSLELIGKALELMKSTNQKVCALMIGDQIKELAQELLWTGVERVYLYDDPALGAFRADCYTEVFADCIEKMKPSVCLVGATTTGRSLAPRVAVRFRTGLTADCTQLKMRENTDLVQIRPAFGGNIMAQIINAHCRPQFATVRYKVMSAAARLQQPQGMIEIGQVTEAMRHSGMVVLERIHQPTENSIEEAEVLVVAGQGVRDQKTLEQIRKLADLLHGSVAFTRPMVEKGWGTVYQQIGLSGRTVKPKLIITCGVSGAIQFTAGMKNSELIVAINKDPQAPIFKLAHVAIVDDVAELLPRLIAELKEESGCLEN